LCACFLLPNTISTSRGSQSDDQPPYWVLPDSDFGIHNSSLDFELPLQAGRGDAFGKLLLSQEVNDQNRDHCYYSARHQ
jgi:hypothetical protein